MAKKKKEPANKIANYIEELKNSVQQRTGKPFEIWLLPQVRATASNMVILETIQDAIINIKQEDLTSSMVGSTGQQKIVVNPLIDKYNALNKILLQQFAALGLNFNTAKGKVSSNEGKNNNDSDPLLQFFEDAKK